jgi:ankyrin repeat protein
LLQVDRRRFSDGCTALYSASAKGHIGIVRCLLEAGADFKLTCAETDVSPLMIAAYHSRLEVVQELLEVGADPNIGSTDGATAIFYAAQKGHLEVIRILLDGTHFTLHLTHSIWLWNS